MAIRFKGMAAGGLMGIAGVIALTTLLAPAASAQETVLETLDDLATRRSGDYYDHLSSFSKVRFITGLGGYPDQRINRDTRALTEAYQELLVLQTQNTATIRVPDLPNPYTTSVQLLPTSQINSRVVGSELNFEPLPRQ